ncbi:MAG: NAD(P)-dependent alcohol dehydrogenase [Burkholderiaceae bacterium]
MKALLQHRYGALPASLGLGEALAPKPGVGEARIRVSYAALNPLDWKIVEGQFKWLVKARPPCGVGFEFSGVVDELGQGADGFPVGTRVSATLPANAYRPVGVAQFAVAPASLLVKIPANVELDQAAAVPIAGLSALQLCRLAAIRKGQRVLINGAAGGVGHLAVQMARNLGAHVTGTARIRNHELVTSLGAEQVIDYRSNTPGTWGGPFDAVIDCAASLSAADIRTLLPHGGHHVSTLPRFPQLLLDPALNHLRSRKHFALMLKPTTGDLEQLIQQLAAGELRVFAEQIYPIDAAVEAMVQLRAGGFAGKIIVQTD